jgi:hypothetical protein
MRPSFAVLGNGKARSIRGYVIGYQRLPTDPIGVAAVTFSGVKEGTEIRVYANGEEVAGVESCVASQTLSWPAYASGNSNNNVIIRIVNNQYKLMEFDYVSSPGAQSIPVQQRLDPWYKNPA